MSRLMVFLSDLGRRLVLWGAESCDMSFKSDTLIVSPISSSTLSDKEGWAVGWMLMVLVFSPASKLETSEVGPFISGRLRGSDTGASNSFNSTPPRVMDAPIFPKPIVKSGREPGRMGGGGAFGPFVAMGAGGGR